MFPHLATLEKRDYHFYDFAGTQEEAGQIGELSRDLDEDAIVYSHTDNYQVLCSSCWRDPDLDHDSHDEEQRRVVTGRIAAPGAIKPDSLLYQLDRSVKQVTSCEVYVPDLCEAAGETDRARVERRRFDMLRSN